MPYAVGKAAEPEKRHRRQPLIPKQKTDQRLCDRHNAEHHRKHHEPGELDCAPKHFPLHLLFRLRAGKRRQHDSLHRLRHGINDHLRKLIAAVIISYHGRIIELGDKRCIEIGIDRIDQAGGQHLPSVGKKRSDPADRQYGMRYPAETEIKHEQQAQIFNELLQDQRPGAKSLHCSIDTDRA